jgi:hypothetical protein
MRRVVFWLECGRERRKEVVGVDDDATDADLDAMLLDLIGSWTDSGWCEEEGGEG